MFSWLAYWAWWVSWRVVVTLVCMITIQHAATEEGYRLEWSTLLITTVCAIIVIRIWGGNSKRDKHVDNS